MCIRDRGWTATAACLVLAFRAYLRPGEVGALRRGHLRLPTDGLADFGRQIVVATVKPKTR